MMSTNGDQSIEDEGVPQMALRALSEAQKKASQSSQAIVFVANGKLWKRTPDGRVIKLKDMPGRIIVSKKTKRAEK